MIKSKARGFALMDILLGVALFSIVIVVMSPAFKYAINRVKVFATERILDKVDFALTQYSIDVGNFPKSKEGGLSALLKRPQGPFGEDWKGPYLEGIKFLEETDGSIYIFDSWSRPIEYHNPPVNFPDKKQYELFSLGANEDDPNGYIRRGR